MSSENQSFMDKLMEKVDVIAGPMTKFGQIPFIRAIVNGMVSAVGVTMIGSIFLILNLFCSDGGLTEHALIPFLKPFSDEFALVNSLSMNIMAVYMAISMGAEYAEIKGFNKTTGAVGTFFAFILLNYASVGSLYVEGADPSTFVSALPINFWGGAGVITAIIAAAVSQILSINVINITYELNCLTRTTSNF